MVHTRRGEYLHPPPRTLPILSIYNRYFLNPLPSFLPVHLTCENSSKNTQTPVSMDFRSTMLSPAHFPDPLTFLPERWLVAANKPDKYLMPFSRGTRGCLGQK